MSSPDRLDRRIQRTRRHLASALVALTLEQGYEAVTIRDITERARVGYATFFRHYHDKDALLADVLETLIGELKDVLHPGTHSSSAHEGTVIFEHVAANKTLYRVLLSSQATHPVLQRIQEASEKEVLAQYAGQAAGAVPAEIAAHHMVSGVISLISWWLDRDEPYPPARMGQIYSRLIVEPVLALLRSPDGQPD